MCTYGSQSSLTVPLYIYTSLIDQIYTDFYDLYTRQLVLCGFNVADGKNVAWRRSAATLVEISSGKFKKPEIENCDPPQICLCAMEQRGWLLADNLAGWPVGHILISAAYHLLSIHQIYPGCRGDFKGVVGSKPLLFFEKLSVCPFRRKRFNFKLKLKRIQEEFLQKRANSDLTRKGILAIWSWTLPISLVEPCSRKFLDAALGWHSYVTFVSGIRSYVTQLFHRLLQTVIP